MRCFMFPVGGKVKFSPARALWRFMLRCVVLFSSLLHPLTARAAPGCCPVLGDGRQWGSEAGGVGAMSLSGILPGLQLYCRRSCVSLGPVSYPSVPYGCLCSIWSDAGYLSCSTCDLQCLLKRIPSWEENNLKPFELVCVALHLGDRAGEIVSGPQVLILSLEGGKP